MRKVSLMVAVLVACTGVAAAQEAPPLDTAISVENFQPAAGPGNYITVEGAGVQPHMNYSVGAYVHSAKGGFSIFTVNNDDELEDTRSEVIDQQTGTELTASLGYKNKFQFGLILPLVIAITGDGVNETAEPTTSGVDATALGDLRLVFKWLAHGNAMEGMSVAVAPVLTVPTSGGKDFVGEELPTFRPRVVVEWKKKALSAAANLGAIFRAPKTVFSSDISQELTYGFAGGYKVAKSLSLFAEVTGRNGFSADLDSSPADGNAGVQLKIGNSISILLGGGAGILRGVGAPQWRAFGGVTWAPDRRDTDGDGVLDVNEGVDFKDNSCLLMPEDRDGFEDSDGCPDPDNDNDGIADDADRCPDEKEDRDNFQDDDGCVDSDDDGDKIVDVKDACPRQPEDGKAPSPDDGCPNTESDSDGDEIADALDKCPQEAEDKDGYQDEDGCIDSDDDNDGVPDELDECKLAAEDIDNFQDEDGCPEPDNDEDGIADAQDQCKDEAEVINGVKDDDGCPDTGGKVLASLGEDGLFVLSEGFKWQKDNVTLSPKSDAMLDQIALWMKKSAKVTKWRIIIAPEKLKKKSEDEHRVVGQKRADMIAGALAARGVALDAIEAKGAFASASQTVVMVAERAGAKPAGDGEGEGGTAGGETPPEDDIQIE